MLLLFFWQGVDIDLPLLVSENHHLFHEVFQLADIPRVRRSLYTGQGARRQTESAALVLGTVDSEKTRQQPLEVLASLPERRQMQPDTIKAEIQIGTEMSTIHEAVEHLIGGGDHPYIHLFALVRSHPADLPLLQYAQ